MDLLIATRSPDKLREIAEMLSAVPGIRAVDLSSAGIAEDPAEESIEAFETFEKNALAKARYFSRKSGKPVLADDSGLCVDVLGGAPGVRSKRFAWRPGLQGVALDRANNERLLEQLASATPGERTAHYVCAMALVTPSGEESLFRGTVEGVILEQPRGTGGFGYDPLFFVSELASSFAEISPSDKHRISHRGRALGAALPRLRQLAEGGANASPQVPAG